MSEEAKAAGDAAKAGVESGEIVIYEGPLKTNEGAEVIPTGKGVKIDDIELEKMDYLIEGVSGSVS